jgi:hypothetical protein
MNDRANRQVSVCAILSGEENIRGGTTSGYGVRAEIVTTRAPSVSETVHFLSFPGQGRDL